MTQLDRPLNRRELDNRIIIADLRNFRIKLKCICPTFLAIWIHRDTSFWDKIDPRQIRSSKVSTLSHHQIHLSTGIIPEIFNFFYFESWQKCFFFERSPSYVVFVVSNLCWQPIHVYEDTSVYLWPWPQYKKDVLVLNKHQIKMVKGLLISKDIFSLLMLYQFWCKNIMFNR